MPHISVSSSSSQEYNSFTHMEPSPASTTCTIPSNDSASSSHSEYSDEPLALSSLVGKTCTSSESNKSNEWSQKTLLSFDGGGIKGYSSLLILRALMFQIATLERALEPQALNSVYPLNNRTATRHSPIQPLRRAGRRGTTFRLQRAGAEHKPVFEPLIPTSEYLPSHYFDYIAGSSTGGLIAIMLGRLSMTVDECLGEYERLAHRVFKHPRIFQVRRPPPILFPRAKYNKKLLEGIIKEIVQKYDPSGFKDSRFPQNNDYACRTIVTAYQEHTIGTTRKPYLFRSYRHPPPDPPNILHRKQMFNRDNFPISQVARATSAAPTYFDAVNLVEGDNKYIFIDGGWGCNNPTEEAYRSIKQLKPNNPNATSVMVSIGTGKPAEPSEGEKAFNSLTFGYYFKYIDSGTKQATDSERIHDNVLDDAQENNIPYFRLNVEKDLGDMKLDAFKGKFGRDTLTAITRATDAWLATEDAKRMIDESARLLVEIRRRRAHHQGPSLAESRQLTNNGSASSNAMENWQDRLYLWERFVHGVEYRCRDLNVCHSSSEVRYERHTLRYHLIERHHYSHDSPDLDDRLDEAKTFPLYEEVSGL